MTKLSSKPQKSIHLTVKISNENTNAAILVLKQRLTEKILCACSTEQVFIITCLSYPELPKKNKQTNIQTKKTNKQKYNQKQRTKHKHTKRREANPPLASFRTPPPPLENSFAFPRGVGKAGESHLRFRLIRHCVLILIYCCLFKQGTSV